MQSARGTLLLKLCRDQGLQSNRIFLQTFIMPTPVMYYKSLSSHSASWSHQYSTACFSFPKNKLIYIKKKKKNTARKSDHLRNVMNGCSLNSCTKQQQQPHRHDACYSPTSLLFLAIGVYVIHPSTALLFCWFSSFPCSPVRALEL